MMTKINKPITCDLILPTQCMLRCRMCNLWKNDISFQDNNWLKLEEYKRFLYELRGFVEGHFHISFGGGEPLLYADKLLDIIRICKELDFETSFPTNGYLINNEMAARIANAGASHVGISLDSLNKKVHDYLRGKNGCWKKALKAIAHLSKYRTNVSIVILTTIMGVNLEGIIDLAKWVYRHPELTGIVFQVIQKPFNSQYSDNWFELEEYADLWPKNIAKINSVLDELIRLRQSYKDGFKISNPVSQFELFKLYFSNPQHFIKPNKCHLGNILRIDTSGDVLLCGEMGPIGNIRQSSIQQTWYSQKADAVKEQIYNCNKNCHLLVNCYYGGKDL